MLVQELAARIASDGGFALVADYGHTGDKTDTFRVCKSEYVSVRETVGMIDDIETQHNQVS